MWQIVRELVAAGTTILLTTQNIDEADELAHRIGQGLPGGGGSAAYLEYVVPGIVFLAVVGGGSSLRSQSPRT
jgi:ABC-2 type transport system ATP-binding protein